MPIGIYKRTKEHGENISKAKRGKRTSHNTEFQKGHTRCQGSGHPMYHKHHTIEAKNKIRNKLLGKKLLDRAGDKHWNWRGGITGLRTQIYNYEGTNSWRNKVFERDNWACQSCKSKVPLEAHHKKEFNIIIETHNIISLEQALNCEELWDINNGITLCKKCHGLTKKGNQSRNKQIFGLWD
uniref:HNH endonuclease n=1 Tax=viral metagenome TaxID=1070528 RepID=A0A6M3LFB6_9ZZZZ